MPPVINTISTRAPGKLVLFGEYAVLEGKTALVASVERFARCTVNSSFEFSLHSAGFGSFNLANLDSAPPILQAVLRQSPPPQAEIKIQSTDLYLDGNPEGCKLGLGSSAAVSTALLKAIFQWTEESQTLAQVFSAAHSAHHFAQGLGSGLDIAAAVFGGVFEYRLADTVQKLNKVKGLITAPAGALFAHIERRSPDTQPSILGIHLGHAASTPKFVRAVRGLKSEDPLLYSRYIDVLGEISRRACTAWIQQDIDTLRLCCKENNSLLQAFGARAKVCIVPDSLHRLNQVLAPLDAIAKTTGAGGGDMAWVVCRDVAHQQWVERALSPEWSVHRMRICPELTTLNDTEIQ